MIYLLGAIGGVLLLIGCCIFIIGLVIEYNRYKDRKFREWWNLQKELEKQKISNNEINGKIENTIKKVTTVKKEVKDNNGYVIRRIIPNYRKQDYVMTYEELKLYRILNKFSEKYNFIIFSQVTLYSIISVNNISKYTALFNKIRSKSIDFVICDDKNGKIKFCIELDDETHNMKKRIKRDDFIDDVFRETGITLVHIKRENKYDENIIENIICKNL